jgi:tetratricopeptide (TPR) repeat protein
MKSDDKEDVLGKGIEAIFQRTAHLRDSQTKKLELPNGTIHREGNDLLIRLSIGKDGDVKSAVAELHQAAQSGLLDQLADQSQLRSQFSEHVDLANMAIQEGDRNSAIEEYKLALKIIDHHDVRFNLAILYEDVKKPDMAIKHYLKILESNPDDSGAMNNLGLLYYRKGDYSKSMDLYQKAIKVNPKMASSGSAGELFGPRHGIRKLHLNSK